MCRFLTSYGISRREVDDFVEKNRVVAFWLAYYDGHSRSGISSSNFQRVHYMIPWFKNVEKVTVVEET